MLHSRLLRLALATMAALTLGAPAAFAAASISGTVGGTMAILGNVKEGGLSLSGSVLWPLEYRWGLEAGVCGFADDFGSVLQDLRDPTTSLPSGQAEDVHRAAYSGSFRLDARPWRTMAWEPFASGSWGLYRLRDDRLGDTRREWSSTGWSLGAGVRRVLRGRATIGAEVRYHRLFNDDAGRYASAALEWGWH